MSGKPPEPEGLAAVARRIAVLTVIVGGLGLALHAGAEIAAGSPRTPFVIAILLAIPLAAISGYQVVDGWRTGAIAVWRESVTRADNPGSYWFNMGWYGLCALALVAIGLWSAWRLVEPAGPG